VRFFLRVGFDRGATGEFGLLIFVKEEKRALAKTRRAQRTKNNLIPVLGAFRVLARAFRSLSELQ
jgi:hypothetical protein